MRARSQVGIGLSYRPASRCSLATQFHTRFLESIPRPIAGLKFSTLNPYPNRQLTTKAARQQPPLLLDVVGGCGEAKAGPGKGRLSQPHHLQGQAVVAVLQLAHITIHHL
jgi:hypothetical protein